MVTKLVEHIVKQLVSSPEAVTVQEVAGPEKRVIQVRVASKDLQNVIGRDGHIFRSLRSLVQVVGGANQFDIVVDIAE